MSSIMYCRERYVTPSYLDCQSDAFSDHAWKDLSFCLDLSPFLVSPFLDSIYLVSTSLGSRPSTMAWRRGFVDRNNDGGPREHNSATNNAQYISEKGGNDAPATYQDASGAPVENDSPLGYSVGPITITLLNITMMIGAGIYSTRMLQLLHD